MDNVFDFLKSPKDISLELVERVKKKRKENKVTQEQLSKIYAVKDSDYLGDIDEIFAAGGSSGGAMPKIYAIIDIIFLLC